MTSKNGAPPIASSAAKTDSPLPWSNRSLRTHRTGTPSRIDNPAQNRSISSARYPTTTTTSSTPASTKFRTARSNRATPPTVTSGLTRPRGVRRRDPFPLASTSPRTTPPSGQAAASEPGSRNARPPQASGIPKRYLRRRPGGHHLATPEFDPSDDRVFLCKSRPAASSNPSPGSARGAAAAHLASELAKAPPTLVHSDHRPVPPLAQGVRHHHPDRRTRLSMNSRASRKRTRPGRPPTGPHRQRRHPSMSKIRLAIAGVGNCANSLLQGLEYYKDADPSDEVPGLMHVMLGGYHIRDIELVAAFDVDAEKVGLDAGKAIWASENNTVKFAEVGELGVTVMRGPTLDGFGEFYRETCEESPAAPVDVAQVLRDTRADVLVSYLPVGSEEAQRYYAQACLDSKTAFVNAIPVFIASDSEWAAKFEEAGVPIVGDDIKSQVGATIMHRMLSRLFEDRGVAIDRTYQLNFGGNMDFKNMLERKRLKSKKISKTQSVTSQIDQGISDHDVHIGPSDHVPWLDDRKWAYIRVEGRNFGDVPLNVELKLEVWDSPNSAGVIIDALRCCKVAQDRGIGGPLLGPSAYFMKSPPIQYRDEEARELVDEFAR